MAYDSISATNLAGWIPQIWSKDILSAVESKLICGSLVDRKFEGYAMSGNSIVVPNLSEITAFAINTAIDATMYDDLQTGPTNISIDKKYGIAVAVDDINQIQTNPKYWDAVKSKAAYSLAKQIDINVATLFHSLDGQIGTFNSALTEDQMIEAYEYLNLGDAPAEGRAWVLDPGSITDLLKLDSYVRMDYVPGSVVSQGFQGRSIYGAPVYITTNLRPGAAAEPHYGAYLQREAIALVVQIPPKFEVARLPLRFSDALVGMCLFGVKEMRGTFGCAINTRE
jgi:hypothetical protein